MPSPTKPRSVGRPRTRPEGCRECPVYLTDAELVRIDRTASDAGLSRAEWLRRMALDAAGIARIPSPKK